MPHRLATSWATLTQVARRAQPTTQEEAIDEPAFGRADVDVVDNDKQEEQEVPHLG